jgi:hypothetical protein
MKKYNLKVYYGNYQENHVITATQFHTQTNNSTSSGFYAFYADDELIACFPICRTAIVSIENIEQ